MKKTILFLLALLFSSSVSLAQNGVPVRNLFGAGPPNGSLAAVVGTTYVDQTGPTVYTCTSVVLTPTSSTCTWTANSGAATVPVTFNANSAPYSLSSSNSITQNNSSLSALFTATNAATVTGIAGGPIDKPRIGNTSGTAASLTVPITIPKGYTVYAFVDDSQGRAFTVTDAGGSTYTQIGATFNSSGGGQIAIFRSTIGGSLQSDSVTATQGGAVEFISVTAIVVPGVLSDTVATPTIGSSTLPTISQTSSAANSFMLSSCIWWNNATITLGTPTGTLQTNLGATSAILGMAMFSTFQPTSGTVTTGGGTLSGTSPWACQAVEVKSGGQTPAYPIVNVAPGLYYYSSGLNPQVPTQFTCPQGATFYYTGSAHAMDLGPAGLTTQSAHRSPPYIVDGCAFTGGSTMTQGIYIQQQVEWVGIRNSFFYNFGKDSTTYAIASAGENWDIEVGPQNRFINDDLQPRGIMITNLNHVSQNTFARFHDNAAWCLENYQNLGCTSAHAGPGIVLDGSTNRIYHNNLMFLNPAMQFICNNSSPCVNNQADQNQIEGPSSGSYNILQYGNGQAGLLFTQNTINMHSTSGAVIGPITGTDTVAGMRVNFNTVTNIPVANIFVAENNVVGQTGNISYSNNCSTAFTPMIPCAKMHTATAGNISAWSGDTYLSCTMNGSTGCTASFLQTYAIAPVCTASWNGAGALTGILKATPSTTGVAMTSSVAGDTAGINIVCSAGDGQ